MIDTNTTGFNVLYLDDEENNLFSFKACFRKHFKVFTASSAKDAIAILEEYPINVIITDQRMPEMTGVEFLAAINNQFPDAIRMILTGFSDMDVIIAAINTGRVFRYITKPWDEKELKMSIDNAFEVYSLHQNQKQLMQNLEEANQTLESKVLDRTKELEVAYNELTQKNESILDSIRYARRIQDSMLPLKEEIQRKFHPSFQLYLPKDIVSGDFYWYTNKNGISFIAAADCTGHGVPGALMTMLGTKILHDIIDVGQETSTSAILNKLNHGVKLALKQRNLESGNSKDGMDIILCAVDTEKQLIHFSGANRDLCIIRNGECLVTRADRMAIGGFTADDYSFGEMTIPVEDGDMVYLFSDGFADQFGGPAGKKYMLKNFKELLLSISNDPMEVQEQKLSDAFFNWKQDLEQIDDILVVGFRFEKNKS